MPEVGREAPCYSAPMSGAYHLSDYPAGEPVVVTCRRCARRGTYDRDRLIAEHGDVALPSLLTILARSCTGRDGWGGCAAVYERPLGSRVPRIEPGRR